MAREWHRRTASDRASTGAAPGDLLVRRLAAPAAGAEPPPGPPQRLVPGVEGPPPSAGRLILGSGWAALAGLLATPTALRTLAVLATGVRPDWTDPQVATGVSGIGLAIGALLALQRRWLPWLLLTAATGLLAGSLSLLLGP